MTETARAEPAVVYFPEEAYARALERLSGLNAFGTLRVDFVRLMTMARAVQFLVSPALFDNSSEAVVARRDFYLRLSHNEALTLANFVGWHAPLFSLQAIQRTPHHFTFEEAVCIVTHNASPLRRRPR